MSIINFNSNIASLRTQRQLSLSVGNLAKSFERLSTGMRINSASDDAAGLAVADRLRVNSRLYTAALRNVNDGTSVSNIITDTIAQQQSIVTRLQELAEQAASGTYSDTQRKALSIEYNSLIQESHRLAAATKFNGQSLLLGERGGSKTLSIHAGINGSSLSKLAIDTVDNGKMSGILSGIVDEEDLPRGYDGEPATAEELRTMFGHTTTVSLTDSFGVSREVILAFSHEEGNIRIHAFSHEGDGAYTRGDTEVINLDPDTGRLIDSDQIELNLTFMGGKASGTLKPDLRGLYFSDIPLDSRIAVGIENSVNLGGTTALDFTSIETAAQAGDALDVLKNRQAQLSKQMGKYGAFQSRLESVANVITSSRENVAAAESRIRDADIANESATLVRMQILQQAGTAVLAQANQQPALLLSLLQQ